MFAYALAILMAFSVLLPINAARRCVMAVVKVFTLVVVAYLVNVSIGYCFQAFLVSATVLLSRFVYVPGLTMLLVRRSLRSPSLRSSRSVSLSSASLLTLCSLSSRS
jgi:hypothetical protein